MAGIVLLSLLGWGLVYSLLVDDDDDAPATSEEEDTAEEIGGSGDDFLDGDATDNRMFGNGGSDFMSGAAGDDSIFGGAGDDGIFGETGDDLLRGGADHDVIIGGEGNDTLRGDTGDDLLQSIEIFDEAAYLAAVQAAESEDDVELEFDYDLETGEADTLHGGFGNDGLFIGSNDEATGGAGEDTFITGDWMIAGEEAVVTDFTKGTDTLVYSYGPDEETPEITFTEVDDGDDAEVRVNGDVVMVLLGVDFSTLTESDVTLAQRNA